MQILHHLPKGGNLWKGTHKNHHTFQGYLPLKVKKNAKRSCRMWLKNLPLFQIFFMIATHGPDIFDDFCPSQFFQLSLRG